MNHGHDENPEHASRLKWRKSSLSNGTGGDCVEVADNLPDIVAVRDSKDPHGPTLVFNPSEWKAFVSGVKGGEFDLP
ncbi:DUF397 domain-containing protein [Nonomuraea sp. CA-218870]|uniref:DUF397 domain-containing protein n=1 Tax=Nonomuraea sp. CA-218870 TaxID=3239998 RepID=UPI003D934B4C